MHEYDTALDPPTEYEYSWVWIWIRYEYNTIWWSAYSNIFGYAQPQFQPPRDLNRHKSDDPLSTALSEIRSDLCPAALRRRNSYPRATWCNQKCCDIEVEAYQAPKFYISTHDWISQGSFCTIVHRGPLREQAASISDPLFPSKVGPEYIWIYSYHIHIHYHKYEYDMNMICYRYDTDSQS